MATVTVSIRANELSSESLVDAIGKEDRQEMLAAVVGLLASIHGGARKGRVRVQHGSFDQTYALGAATGGAVATLTFATPETAGTLSTRMNAPAIDPFSGLAQVLNYLAGLAVGAHKAGVSLSAGSFSRIYDFGFPSLWELTYTRASEAAAVDEVGEFFDLATPWPGVDAARLLNGSDLFIEGTAENLITESSDLTEWTDGGASVSTGVTAPDGTATACTLTDASGSAVSRNIEATTVNGTEYVLSVYLRKEASPSVYPLIRVDDTSVDSRIVVNPATGAFVRSAVGDDFVEVLDAGDWWRVLLGYTAGGTTATVYLFPAWNTTGLGPVGAAAQGSHTFWGVQLEEGPIHSSVIRTDGAAATRAVGSARQPSADVPSFLRTGRFRVDVWPAFSSERFMESSITLSTILQFIPGNEWILGFRKSGSAPAIGVFDGGWDNAYVGTADGAGDWSPGDKISVTVDQAAGTASVAINDVAVGSGSSGQGDASSGTDMYVGVSNAGLNPFFGRIRRPVEV